MTRARLLLGLLGASAACERGPMRPHSPEPIARAAASGPSDVVMILLDTVRADFLEPYGAPAGASPWIGRLASRAVVFERAFSTSTWTPPSVASLFTGLYPTRHGVTNGYHADWKVDYRRKHPEEQDAVMDRLPASVETLPERLRAAGYATCGLTNNLNIGEAMGFGRGFERFRHDRHVSADELAADARAWRLESGSRSPRFLYLHLNDAHAPYVAREPWYRPGGGADDDAAARYASQIRALDETLAALEADGAWDERTLLVLLSDHGEEFREHGDVGHRFSVHHELNHIALLIAGRGLTPRRIADVNVSLVDVAPTVLELVGLRGDGDGCSLVPLLRGDAWQIEALRRRTLFVHRERAATPEAIWAVLDGSLRMIEHDRDGRRELFDFAADPREQLDLASARGADILRMARELDAFRSASCRIETSPVRAPLDPALRADLRALGYLEGGDDDEAGERAR